MILDFANIEFNFPTIYNPSDRMHAFTWTIGKRLFDTIKKSVSLNQLLEQLNNIVSSYQKNTSTAEN